MIEMIAREIGEGGQREPNAVEAALIDPERRRLHGEMRDAAPREFVERAMQLDRARRRQRAIMRARGVDDADRAERRRFKSERPPNLTQERDDRGLAAGAGDGRDGFGLTRIKARGGQRQGGAGVGDDDQRQIARRLALGDHDAGAARLGVGDEVQAVAGETGNREKCETMLHGAAVRADPGDVEIGQGRVQPGAAQQFG